MLYTHIYIYAPHEHRPTDMLYCFIGASQQSISHLQKAVDAGVTGALKPLGMATVVTDRDKGLQYLTEYLKYYGDDEGVQEVVAALQSNQNPQALQFNHSSFQPE